MRLILPIRHLFVFPAIIVLGLCSNISRAQLVVDNNVDALDGVQNVLLGGGVTATNITFSGVNQQIGSFNCSTCNLNIASGLVMGSGNVSGAIGPNTSGSTNNTPASGFGFSDPDLAELSGFSLNDAAVLQFDFIPTGDSLAFNFVFGSDEYPEFANGSFNDAFGFFLSGPGISGPYLNNAANIALIPNTTVPVTINNLNNGTSNSGPCEYCQYYVNNLNSFSSPATAIQCDGFTTVLTAYAQVTCGETYHIKLAIADAGDTSYDSFVFLQAGSFQSNQIQAGYTGAAIAPSSNAIFEGCDSGFVTLTRAPGQNTAADYALTLNGTAMNGVDYTTIPSTVSFVPLQSELVIPISALQDGVLEGIETIQIEVEGLSCGSSSSLTIDVEINDLPPLNVLDPVVTIDCGGSAWLEPAITGGIGYYSVVWDNLGIADSVQVSPSMATQYSYTVLDTCGVVPVDGIAEVNFFTYPAITVDLGGNQTLTCLDDIIATGIVSGGYGNYSYAWSFNNAAIGTNSSTLNYFAGVPGNLELEVTDDCGTQESETVSISIPAVPITVDLGNDIQVTCIDQTVLDGSPTGGVGNYSYQWTQQSGNLGTNPTITFQTDESTSVVLTVADECGNIADDIIAIQVPQVSIDVDLGEDLVVDCTQSIPLSGDINGGVGNYSYAWVFNGQNASVTSSYTVNTSSDASLSLTVTDQCGNTSFDQIQIEVPAVQVLVDAGPDLNVTCIDVSLLQGTVTGGIGNYTYSWNDGGGVVGIGTNLSYTTSQATSLTLTAEDECGNVGSDNLMIYVPPVPVELGISNDTTICIGEIVDLFADASGGVGDFTYAWSTGNSSSDHLYISPTVSAVYEVMVEDECSNTATASVSVNVEDVVPSFSFDYIGEYGIEVTNQTVNAAEISWAFGDEIIPFQEHVVYEFPSLDEWQVTLNVQGQLGCVKSITEFFHPLANIYIPSAFTPNGDGINDVFLMKGHDLKRFEITIFNRWGDVVFVANDIDQAWIGDTKDGAYYVPDGVYNYALVAEGIRGNIIEKNGTITIFR
ncbi:MAG: hypothetical protein RL204_151 [Bacteroidota bacterium]|jgi:gliding motility-associated-like protein